LAAVIGEANVHDTKLLQTPLEAIVVERPVPPKGPPQHLRLSHWSRLDDDRHYCNVQSCFLLH